MKEEIKLEKRKPTFDYMLNDLALDSLIIKCIHSNSATYQEKFDLQYQIKLMQKEIERLKEENKRIFSKVNDDELLISNAMNYAEAQEYKSRNEKAIEYVEHENFKRNILVGVSTKKYTRDILNNVLNILKGDKDE